MQHRHTRSSLIMRPLSCTPCSAQWVMPLAPHKKLGAGNACPKHCLRRQEPANQLCSSPCATTMFGDKRRLHCFVTCPRYRRQNTTCPRTRCAIGTAGAQHENRSIQGNCLRPQTGADGNRTARQPPHLRCLPPAHSMCHWHSWSTTRNRSIQGNGFRVDITRLLLRTCHTWRTSCCWQTDLPSL